jgi:hypothetical protein
MEDQAAMKYKIVMDDVETWARAQPMLTRADPEVVSKLTFGITFDADSEERMQEVLAMATKRLGKCHIERVEDVPREPTRNTG